MKKRRQARHPMAEKVISRDFLYAISVKIREGEMVGNAR